MHHQALAEVAHAQDVDVAVENGSGDEQGLFLVVFLLVQVKYFLDAEGAHVLSHSSILFFADGTGNFLAKRLLLVLLNSEVIFHGKSLLHGSKSEVAALGELRVVLVLGAYLLSLVENRIFLHNVLDVNFGQVHVNSVPSLLHNLGKVYLSFFLISLAAVRVDRGHEVSRHVALGAEFAGS